MNVHVLTAGAIRVMLFTGSVLALMHGASIVLRTQASWIAMAIFIGLGARLWLKFGASPRILVVVRIKWLKSSPIRHCFLH
jgi:hypothetical protein